MQRDDTEVLDEPLYAHYLRLKPNLSHPSQEEVLRLMVSVTEWRCFNFPAFCGILLSRSLCEGLACRWTRFDHLPICHVTQCFYALQENDGDKVVRDIIYGPCKKKYRYAKVAILCDGSLILLGLTGFDVYNSFPSCLGCSSRN